MEEGWERDEGGHPGKAQHSSRRAATPHRSPDAHRPDKASRPAVYDCYRLPVPITEEGAGGRARSARGPKNGTVALRAHSREARGQVLSFGRALSHLHQGPLPDQGSRLVPGQGMRRAQGQGEGASRKRDVAQAGARD